MRLNELLRNIKNADITGNADVEITGVNIDSRRISEGHLFVAMRGTQVDGHRFIPKAIEQGASAVLCEELPEMLSDNVTYVKVTSTEDTVGPVATVFYGNPSEKLKLVGVTGTNGKTTIATLYIICSVNWDTSAVCSRRYVTTLRAKRYPPTTPLPTQ